MGRWIVFDVLVTKTRIRYIATMPYMLDPMSSPDVCLQVFPL